MKNLIRCLLKAVGIVFLLLVKTIPGFSQVEVSFSAGAFKSYNTYTQKIFSAPKGELRSNLEDVTFSAGIQASIPIQERFRLQAGIRVMQKVFASEHQFNYPDQFSLTNAYINSGMSLDLPVNLIYEFPDQILGRSIRVNAGISVAKNNIDHLGSLFNVEIFAPPPSTVSYSFNHEIINSKRFLTPGIEAGFEISPIFFRSIDFKVLYHLDLVPAFGGVHYRYKFHYASSLPIVLDEPEGTLKAKRTSYFLIQLSYRLPFFKNKNAETSEIEQE